MIRADVSQQWATVRSNLAAESSPLLPFFDAAAEEPQIASLFPFRAMQQLCFSRCARFRFFVDYFAVHSNGAFGIHRTPGRGGWIEGREVARGDAATAARRLAELLPAAYGPAYDCTADELRAAFHTGDGIVQSLSTLEREF